MNNPYTLVFGKEPSEHISRFAQASDVIRAFSSENPPHQMYLISGVRGCGKTVFMTEIQRTFINDKDWVVAELNPEKDMLLSLASKLSSESGLARIFQKASINLSFWGFGLEVTNTPPVSDIETAVSKMLDSLKKHNKRILVTVDEITGNQYVKEFIASFQIMIRQDLPIFLLATGLYDNIRNLQNEKSLTFLYRAPRIDLRPLNIASVAQNYKKNLNVDDDKARQMAKLIRGYSFAFQVLGYFSWGKNGDYEAVLPDLRLYLDEYVYDKIWSELSAKDKSVLQGISEVPSGKIEDIRKILNMDSNEFNPYRKRLIDKGIISGEDRGYVKFELPMFEEYVQDHI